MKYAVISGKGGTGKTFISTHLAQVAKDSIYMDCDIEEPNGHIYLKTDQKEIENVYVNQPVFDMAKCIGCQDCVKFCKFNALAFVIDQVYLFNELCHSCLGCQVACKYDAVHLNKHEIGKIYKWQSDDTAVISGKLNIGEATGVKIIQTMIEKVEVNKDVVIDGPPGSGCEVMDVIKESDYVLLIAEPTRFGMHNFMMVYEIAKLFNKPIGVIINKADTSISQVEKYCMANNIKILEKFTFDIKVAKQLSEGNMILLEQQYKKRFEKIYEYIKDEALYEKNSSA